LLSQVDELEDSVAEFLREAESAMEYQDEREWGVALARAKALAARWGGQVQAGSPETLASAAVETLGEYRLIHKLGEGGMGCVWLAEHTRLKRRVALKVLRWPQLAAPASLQRFQREMAVVGQVSHPNIVHAYDARQIGDTHFLVMEYVEGVTAAEALCQLGPLSIADACEVARQAAEGLQHIHEHGLVHRDIKPSNLMISRDGTVKILDLGLARWVRSAQAEQRELTGSGQIMGTLDYMAPEQFSDSHAVDIRADIYSLGCTLSKLLTDRASLERPDTGSGHKEMADESEPGRDIREYRPDVPAELSAVIGRMLAESPADRYQTPREVAEALVPFAAGSDLRAVVEEAGRRRTAVRKPAEQKSTGQPAGLAETPAGQEAARPARQPRSRKMVRGTRLLVAAAAVLAAAGVAGALYYSYTAAIRIKTPHGQVVIEFAPGDFAPESARVKFDGELIRIKGPRNEIRVKPGTHLLEVNVDGFHTFTRSFTVERDGKVVVKVRLEPLKPAGIPTPACWPHEGQNLQNTHFLAKPSVPIARPFVLQRHWHFNGTRYVRSADLNRDGLLEIVFLAGSDQKLHLLGSLTFDGYFWWGRRVTDVVKFPKLDEKQAQFWRFYDVADLNGDGSPEIIVNANCDVGGTKDKPNHLLVFTGGGGLLRDIAVEPGAWAQPLAGDLTGDNRPEIAVGISDFLGQYGAYFYKPDGTLLAKRLYGESPQPDAIADIDGDGINEALFFNFASHTVPKEKEKPVNGVSPWRACLMALEGDGTEKWVRQIGDRYNRVVVCDLESDGRLDILAFRHQDPDFYPGPNEIHQLDPATGRTVRQFPAPGQKALESQHWNGWVVADLDGDRLCEIVVAHDGERHKDGTTGPSALLLLDHRLRLLKRAAGWPEPVTVHAGNDLDGDGKAEIVISYANKVCVLDGKLNTLCPAFELDSPVRDVILSDLDANGTNELLVETARGLRVLGLHSRPGRLDR